MHYVVGDIHGCLTEWLTLKEKVEQLDNNAEFILLGDVIDRGPQVVEMCEWFINNVLPDGRVKSVIGNHEWDKIRDLDDTLNQCRETDVDEYWDEVKCDLFDQYGSIKQFPTYNSYKHFIEFCRTLPFYIDINVNSQRYIIVHADVPKEIIKEDGTLKANDTLSIHEQDKIVWTRNEADFTLLPNTIVVNGHTPTIDGYSKYVAPATIDIEEHRYNIDCGCVYSYDGYNGNLAALCLETKDVIYLH